MSKMLFEALFFVRIKNIKYSWNLFHYLIEINYSKILILSKKRNISKVRQNLKYEIEAIRSHHNLKWVKLELYLHIQKRHFLKEKYWVRVVNSPRAFYCWNIRYVLFETWLFHLSQQWFQRVDQNFVKNDAFYLQSLFWLMFHFSNFQISMWQAW